MKFFNLILAVLTKFTYRSLCKNHWGWFHGAAGAIGALFFLTFRTIHPLFILLIIFILATLWEFFKFFIINNKEKIIATYGTIEDFLYDSAGDIFLSCFFCFTVIFPELFRL